MISTSSNDRHLLSQRRECRVHKEVYTTATQSHPKCRKRLQRPTYSRNATNRTIIHTVGWIDHNTASCRLGSAMLWTAGPSQTSSDIDYHAVGISAKENGDVDVWLAVPFRIVENGDVDVWLSVPLRIVNLLLVHSWQRAKQDHHHGRHSNHLLTELHWNAPCLGRRSRDVHHSNHLLNELHWSASQSTQYTLI